MMTTNGNTPLLLSSLTAAGRPTPYARLITNPARFEGPVREALDPGFAAAKAYIERTIQGAQGKPYCPFVKMIYDNNSYLVRPYSQSSVRLDLPAVFGELAADFTGLPASERRIKGKTDLTILIGVFSSPDCATPRFHLEMEEAHAQVKEAVREQGLMIGIMGPHHPPGGRSGGSEPMFVCDVPIVVVRAMDRSDQVFMTSERSKAAYSQRFETPVAG